MQISKINSQNQTFTAKNQLVRDADWVMRKARYEFPHISTTRILHCGFGNKLNLYKNFYGYILDKSGYIKTLRDLRHLANSNFKFIKIVLSNIKDDCVGNCYEEATLAELILRMNGIKNCVRAEIYTNNGKKSLDHCVLLIDKHPNTPIYDPHKVVIIDPWIGVADWADKIFSIYKNQYFNYFRVKHDGLFQLKLKNNLKLTNEEIEFFKKKYPQLLYHENPKSDRKFMANI